MALTDGNALIPAFSMAMTNGDEAAVLVASCNLGSLEGTSNPMMNVPPM